MVIAKDYIKNSILGAIVGDAMGVPYEWKTSKQVNRILKDYMVADNRRMLPSGAWSDDSSMILCTVESLNNTGRDMVEIANNYVKWYDENHWTSIGRIFDMGGTTRVAMENIRNGCCVNGLGEMDKGNGSLMRVLPMSLYLRDKGRYEIKEVIENFSTLTHGSTECKIACVWYSLIVKHILEMPKLAQLYSVLFMARKEIEELYSDEELEPFNRILSGEILFKRPEELNGSGYVVHSLEVVINCLFNQNGYRDAILRAISVGNDTDTNACLVGGIMGLIDDIPESWLNEIMRKDDIIELLDKIDWR